MEDPDRFVGPDGKTGNSDWAKHWVDVQDAAPLKVSYHGIPWAKQQIADEQVEKMLEQGIIEPSDSPWAFPTVLLTSQEISSKWLPSVHDESLLSHCATTSRWDQWVPEGLVKSGPIWLAAGGSCDEQSHWLAWDLFRTSQGCSSVWRANKGLPGSVGGIVSQWARHTLSQVVPTRERVNRDSSQSSCCSKAN